MICWPGSRLIRLRPLAGLGGAMELFTQLFGDVLAFVYHCFDRIVIYGYLSGLSRPEQVVHFFRNVVGVAVVSKDVLSQRTADYQAWVEAYARNHRLPLDRDDDADKLRQRLLMRPACRIEKSARPQGPGYVLEQLGE